MAHATFMDSDEEFWKDEDDNDELPMNLGGVDLDPKPPAINGRGSLIPPTRCPDFTPSRLVVSGSATSSKSTTATLRYSMNRMNLSTTPCPIVHSKVKNNPSVVGKSSSDKEMNSVMPHTNKRASPDHTSPTRSNKIKRLNPESPSKSTSNSMTSIEISTMSRHASAASKPKIVPLRQSKSAPVDHQPTTSPPPKTVPATTMGSLEIPPRSADTTYLQTFFDKVKLQTKVIAHDKVLQHVLDRHRVPWGAQYEIYRGIQTNQWTANEVMKKVLEFKDTSDGDVMYRVASMVKGVPLPKNATNSISRELAREQAAIIENAGRGLGLMGPWGNSEDWYGGRIQQIVKLCKGDSGEYRLELKPMEMKRSNRLARHLGSRRIIQLKCSGDLLKQERDRIIHFLAQSFVLAGRVFIPTPPKDDNLYLIEVREDYERNEQTWCGDQYRLSYSQFIDWHNPLGSNSGQPLAKWFTRFHILLSTSVPALEFEEKNIEHIPDIITSDCPTEGKAPTEKITTDGAGWINRAALRLITVRFNYSSIPTAVQGRIGGAKGMWSIHPNDDSAEPKIWLRDSQCKIKYTRSLDRSQRIFDLLHVSHTSLGPSTVSLSRQSVLNLCHNGVPIDILSALMQEGLEQTVKELTNWEGDDAMVALWDAINRIGGVSLSRLSKYAAGMSGALGLTRRKPGMEDDETEAEDDEAVPSRGVHEACLEAIQSGFNPRECEHLSEKVRRVLEQFGDSAVKRLRIPLPEGQAVNAYVIPDPLGVLEYGQVYYRSSMPMRNTTSQTLFHVMEGDVLIFRYPLRLPSDIQKVTAVNVDELYDWPDVIIVSTKGGPWGPEGTGLCSLMSVLGGGDADGDDAYLILVPSIVRGFQPKKLVPPPANLQVLNFESNVETVTAFNDRVKGLPDLDAQEEFVRAMLDGFDDGKVGIYSTFHDAAVFKSGYDSRGAIRLAYMDNLLLDASKTGLRLRKDVLSKDQKKFGGLEQRPPSMGGTCTKQDTSFSLNVLSQAARDFVEQLLQRYDQASKDTRLDPDLLSPWKAAEHRAQHPDLPEGVRKLLSDELRRIERHVDAALKQYRQVVSRQSSTSSVEEDSRSGAPRKATERQRRRDKQIAFASSVRMFNSDVPGILLLTDMKKIKASYAYKKSPVFAFHVASQDLCYIKTEAQGGNAATLQFFDQVKTISPGWRRLLENVAEAGDHL